MLPNIHDTEAAIMPNPLEGFAEVVITKISGEVGMPFIELPCRHAEGSLFMTFYAAMGMSFVRIASTVKNGKITKGSIVHFHFEEARTITAEAYIGAAKFRGKQVNQIWIDIQSLIHFSQAPLESIRVSNKNGALGYNFKSTIHYAHAYDGQRLLQIMAQRVLEAGRSS